METYLFPIKIAIILFPIIALIFTFPFAIYQYRKYDYINKLRILILYSFLLYLITAYFLVILPLPQTRDILSLRPNRGKYYQLVPFNFIKDFLRETKVIFSQPGTYKYLLNDRAFLQAGFNILLLVPLGVYLRYYFKKNLKVTLLITFLVSLFFELTQLTGLYGFYNAPYRLFDVDDLILNTLGGIIGFLIAPLFTFFLPKANELDLNIDLQHMRVGIFRRTFACMIDWGIIGFFITKNDLLLIKLFAIFIYFIVIVYLTNGRTFGKWLLRIKVKGKSDKLTFKEIFLRYFMLYFIVLIVNNVLPGILETNNDIIITVFSLLFLFIFNFSLLIHFFISVITKHRFYYEKLSNTKNVIVLK